MKKTKRKKSACGGTVPKMPLKRLVVAPLIHCIEANALAMKALIEKLFTKMQDVEDLIDITAREIKRQSDQKT